MSHLEPHSVDSSAQPVASHPAAHDLDFPLPQPARFSRARMWATTALVIALVIGGFGARYLLKRRQRQALETGARDAALAVPRVQVIAPAVASAAPLLNLPASVLPFDEVVIYSRANGYVKHRHADLGDQVKAGDLLAEIDTPELDQQVEEARAHLAQATAGLLLSQANADYSRQTLDRNKQLAPDGIVSLQDVEKTRAQARVDMASVTVANAAVDAQRATLRQLLRLKSFARVLAPFAGTITERSVALGALVNGGTSSPMYKLASMDPVRVRVHVPQNIAPSVRVGASANVTVREFPGRIFQGRLARTAAALDSATRTMTVEVHAPNPGGELLSGMHAEVALTLPSPHQVFVLPATTLLNDGNGTHLAVVGPDGRIEHRSVVIERDTGSTFEIASGLDGTERVVKLPNPELAAGCVVEIAQ